MMSGVTPVSRPETAKQSGSVSGKGASAFSTVLKGAVLSQKEENLNGIFHEAAAKYDVPERLLKAVGKAESGFQADAVSSCGAEGIMQLMPSTASALGVENPFNPEQNIMGGAKYLSQLLSSFGGNAKLAVAAYNAGSGAVRKYGGVPPYRETQNYVKKVLGYAGEDISALGSAPATSVAEGLGNLSLPISDSLSAGKGEDTAALSGTAQLSLSSYQLFAKAYVQRLEQQALNVLAEESTAQPEKSPD